MSHHALHLLVGASLIGLGALALSPAVNAQARDVPQTREQVQLSFAPLVKRVAPAVVNIFTRKNVQDRAVSPLFDDPLFRRFFGDDFLPFGQPRERMESSLGSGVIVRPDGLVVTNNHVIASGTKIIVALTDRREFEAEVVLADERTDLAVLKIDVGSEVLPALELMNSDDLEVGDLVLALGNPFGVGQTVTSGIVSALARTKVGISDFQFFIQTDAAINPGNSGGALVTMDGRLAGVNTAIFSRSGGSIGIGFAIPANMVASVINAAVSGGEIRRPWLGAAGQLVTGEIAETLGLDRPGGVLVTHIFPGSPADLAGLLVGDVIMGIDGKPVEDPQGLVYRIAIRPVGELAILDVLRSGQSLSLPIKLLVAPELPPRNVTDIGGRNPLTGARVANLSPALATELGFDTFTHGTGVIVLAVARFSPAQQARAQPGDVILDVNGEQVTTVEDLVRLLDAAPQWRITLRRGDQQFVIAARS
ncbi:MAG: DegQ family serine endoprotease [Proteobacteria bacterium]|nr:DegQ family serine endoprotease [Pseudomonadota bacterium]MDA1059528.1 DegQ family serine endoprotease [Pseudomonadota bacterium]